MVLGVASKPLATLCSSTWIDVRDLALAHIEAVYIRPETSNTRFVVCSTEKSDFQREAEIIKETFPGWGKRPVSPICPAARAQIGLDGEFVLLVAFEFGLVEVASNESACFSVYN